MSQRRFPFVRPTPLKSISKVGVVSTDRNIAQAPQPASETGAVDGRTLLQTYFTSLPKVGEDTPILYNGDRLWARITLTLETAGPVAVGTQSNIDPVLSGKGQLLQTGVPITFDIMKGTRLYVISTGINRIKFATGPIPWLEMIAGLVGRLVSALAPGVVHPAAPPSVPKSKL
jgi:hypothetical protein